MKNKYRIVEDDFSGYEAQVKYWYFPFKWFEIHTNDMKVNTSKTKKEAQKIIDKHKKNIDQ